MMARCPPWSGYGDPGINTERGEQEGEDDAHDDDQRLNQVIATPE